MIVKADLEGLNLRFNLNLLKTKNKKNNKVR